MRYITEKPEEDTEEVTYKAIIDFTPDENVFLGMTVVVSSAGKTEAADRTESSEEDEPVVKADEADDE